MASASSDKLDQQQRVIGYSITSLASSVEGIFFAAVTAVIAGGFPALLHEPGICGRRSPSRLTARAKRRAALQREPLVRVAGGTNGVGPTYVARATEATG